MKLPLLGLSIGLIVYVASSGRVVFLPLIVFLPLGWLYGSRKRYPLLSPRKRSSPGGRQ